MEARRYRLDLLDFAMHERDWVLEDRSGRIRADAAEIGEDLMDGCVVRLAGDPFYNLEVECEGNGDCGRRGGEETVVKPAPAAEPPPVLIERKTRDEDDIAGG